MHTTPCSMAACSPVGATFRQESYWPAAELSSPSSWQLLLRTAINGQAASCTCATMASGSRRHCATVNTHCGKTCAVRNTPCKRSRLSALLEKPSAGAAGSTPALCSTSACAACIPTPRKAIVWLAASAGRPPRPATLAAGPAYRHRALGLWRTRLSGDVVEQTQVGDFHVALLRRREDGALQRQPGNRDGVVEVFQVRLHGLVDQADVGDEIARGVQGVEPRTDRTAHGIDLGVHR